MPGLNCPPNANRIAVLQSGAGCQAWIRRAHELLQRAGQPGIVGIWQRTGFLGVAESALAPRIAGPARSIERGSYNPTTRDAMAVGPGIAGADERTVSNLLDLDAAIRAMSVNVLLCESDCDVEQLLAVAHANRIRLWQMGECWSDQMPTCYARHWLSGKKIIETSLDEITSIGGRKTLAFTRSQVAPCAMSHGIHAHLWKLAHMPARALSGHLPAGSVENERSSRLTNTELVRIAGTQVYRRGIERLTKASKPSWALAVGPSGKTGLLPSALEDFKPIVPPSDRFWADPFLVRHADRLYMFFEELPYDSSRGHISVVEIGEDGSIGPTSTVLNPPWHLSYPHVFEHDGVWYMTPESGKNGRIDLYKCTEMPLKWEFERTLINDIEAYDPTLLFHDGLWWIFSSVTDRHGVGPNDELFIHYTDDLLNGTWTPHPGNPVISDVTRARPAGAFFRSEGKIYRPAQDSRGRYGYGLVIHEVETLTTSAYSERVARRVSVAQTRLGWCGLHTYNACERMAVIDFDRYYWSGAMGLLTGSFQY